MADSSSEESGEENWVFYCNKPEWADVTPLQQDDGPAPVVAIAYSKKFQDVYDYFRAVLKANEKSERALQLTVDALTLNPANYTVWQYRREIIKELKKDLFAELRYVKKVISQHPKNYQVWHHRRVIVEWTGVAGAELDVTGEILEDDAKNYHAWQHRQWVLTTFQLFDEEWDYVNRLIDEDIRNNSAWNQRYFVLKHATNFHPDIIRKEIKYTLNKIILVKKNESSWNYLRGLLFHCDSGLLDTETVASCRQMYDGGCRSAHLLAFLVDVALALTERQDFSQTEPAKAMLTDLITKHDPIRVHYWRYMERKLDRALAESGSTAVSPT